MDQVHVPLMPIMPTQRPCLRTLNQCLMQYRFSQGQRACFDGGFVLNIFFATKRNISVYKYDFLV